ncbi:unnamed protein product, partial [Discosporangium mesarthrocarpum]
NTEAGKDCAASSASGNSSLEWSPEVFLKVLRSDITGCGSRMGVSVAPAWGTSSQLRLGGGTRAGGVAAVRGPRAGRGGHIPLSPALSPWQILQQGPPNHSHSAWLLTTFRDKVCGGAEETPSQTSRTPLCLGHGRG